VAQERLDTAHQSWDRGWGQAETRAHWTQPEPAVTELTPALTERGVRRVLDVGTGIGRHALAFARAGFEECGRVLRSGGTAQLTMLSKRHRAFGIGREIRPDTFVDDASTGDKDHPHFYVDATTLTAMLNDAHFEVRSALDIDQQSPGGFHWTVLAEATPNDPGLRFSGG
jgi:hypothetical protein